MKNMDVMEKLRILTDAAKFDVACTSSGSERGSKAGTLGNTVKGGICHSFAADGRCISLLKILMTNYCICDCAYCINRCSNDVERACFTPDEIAGLTINFYRRNYIEGLFLSSGIIKDPDYTMELVIQCVTLLRQKYHFNGYIHCKVIPGTSEELITRLGLIADRVSVNIELPSEVSLKGLAPYKQKHKILAPMKFIKDSIAENKYALTTYKSAPAFAPAGQATQMIIGATPDTDRQIIMLSEGLYNKFRLKRVFYSAYTPVGDKALIPSDEPPPMLREHRLYQCDWLIRFYKFKAAEILDEANPNLNPFLDPKCFWALTHLEHFPVEINKADYDTLLRVPGIGQISAQRIVDARQAGSLDFDDLKKIGVVLKRAVYFITCKGRMKYRIPQNQNFIYQNLVTGVRLNAKENSIIEPELYDFTQLSLFPKAGQTLFDIPSIKTALPAREDAVTALTGQI